MIDALLISLLETTDNRTVVPIRLMISAFCSFIIFDACLLYAGG